MTYLDLDDLLHSAVRTLGAPAQVRDHGLLESALAPRAGHGVRRGRVRRRPREGAALLHSIAGNPALVDANKRLVVAAVVAFYAITASG